jgi:hypothetical protein
LNASRVHGCENTPTFKLILNIINIESLQKKNYILSELEEITLGIYPSTMKRCLRQNPVVLGYVVP